MPQKILIWVNPPPLPPPLWTMSKSKQIFSWDNFPYLLTLEPILSSLQGRLVGLDRSDRRDGLDSMDERTKGHKKTGQKGKRTKGKYYKRKEGQKDKRSKVQKDIIRLKRQKDNRST